MAPPLTTDSTDSTDPTLPGVNNGLAGDDTLAVGHDASLTLATDSLIVLDEHAGRRKDFDCCGLFPPASRTSRAIPFFNILWAELSDLEITVTYAQPTSKTIVRAAYLHYKNEKTDQRHATVWIEQLLERAYGKSQRNKRIKVLINPFGGIGSAEKWYHRNIKPIFAAARCDLDVEHTAYSGHAVEIAERLDIDKYDVIASCSGDGLPHEVFNGLGKRKDARRALSKVAVVQLPCGSGNAMNLNLNGNNSTSMAALSIVKGIQTPIDLVSITQGDKRSLSFLSQSVGIIAESDLGTDNIRWMGSARFTVGYLLRIMGKTTYPCEVAVKVDIPTKEAIREHYKKELEKRPAHEVCRDVPETDDNALPPLKFGSVKDHLPSDWSLTPYSKMGSWYCGNMAYMAPDAEFFPAALPNDGYMDLCTLDGDVSRITALQCITKIANGKFFHMPCVKCYKISGYRIIPKNQEHGYISIDGESYPFEPFQAEVHKGLGTVLSRTGHIYEIKEEAQKNFLEK